MTAKKLYSDSVAKQKTATSTDAELGKKIKEGQARSAQYKANWQSVDLNELVDRFAPGSIPSISPNNGNKVYYQIPGVPIRIVADLGGGYCRIEDWSSGAKRPQCLNLDGTNGHNYTDEHGKTHGRRHAEYNQATHFRIKKEGEL